MLKLNVKHKFFHVHLIPIKRADIPYNVRMEKFSLSDLTLRPTTPVGIIATARNHVEKERNVGRDCEQVEPEKEWGGEGGRSGRM